MKNENQYNKFFQDFRKCLIQWIESALFFDVDSYENFVLSKIKSKLLRERLATACIDSLSLTLLLSLIDKNWDTLRKHHGISQSYRHSFLTVNRIQNRSRGFVGNHTVSPQEKNALSNVLRIISAPQELKTSFLALFQATQGPADCQEGGSSTLQENSLNIVNQNKGISPLSLVCLKSDPSKSGVVLKVDGDRLLVHMDGTTRLFFFDQVKKIEEKKPGFVPLDTARNGMVAFLLSHPVSNSLYSLKSARVDVIPYQYKPVLKVIRSDQPRILIADGVGLGKTIEAGLILRELEVRNNVKSVLIICPKPLVTEEKWSQELRRFDEDFDTLDSKRLRYCLSETDKEGVWPEKLNKVILPFSLCDEKLLATLVSLDPPPKFDMVIVDEAHHIRNPKTKAHQIVERFCDNAESVIFLTATPLQMGNQDLYTLLHCLRPSDVTDEETFRDLQAPNQYITKACRYAKAKRYREALEELQQIQALAAAQVVQSNALYEPTIQLLKKGSLDNNELVTLVDNICGLHTFDSFINRTLRKDVATDFCVRHPNTIQVAFTEEEGKIYTELIRLRARILRDIHGIDNVRFMMNMLERQASSSIHGLAPFIEEMLLGSLSEEDLLSGESEEVDLSNKLSLREKYAKQVESLGQKASVLSDEDPKFEALRRVVLDKQRLDNPKLIVFSTFRNTLSYLQRRLEEEGIRVGLIHGGVSDSERQVLRGRFAQATEEEDTIDVMLFSEVGCEGLDYQFCDTLINYDLPWNPMKIEQRIGRIDRFGQVSEAIAIYNIIVSGTIDSDIYDRCLTRINIFESSVGDCDEILGEIYKQIRNVCEDIQLSSEQRQEKLEQIAVNECRKLKQQRELESQQASLFSMPSDLTADRKLQEFENPWLSANSMEDLVSAYLRSKAKSPNAIIFSDGERKIRLSLEAKNILWSEYIKSFTKRNKNYRTFENYLQGSDLLEPVTFSSEDAVAQPDTQFIMPMHPLPRMASKYFYTGTKCLTNLQVFDDTLPEGSFSFEVYGWEYRGNGQKVELRAFCENEVIQENLLQLLLVGASSNGEEIPQTEVLNEKIKNLWETERQKHIESSQNLARIRTQSLKLSSQARRRTAEARTQGEAMAKFRENWLRKIDTEQAEKEQEIINQAEKADIICHEILAGVLTICHEVP